jgi:hypothetical protein
MAENGIIYSPKLASNSSRVAMAVPAFATTIPLA